MICENCGKKINGVNINHFNYDGADSDIFLPLKDIGGDNAVMFETDTSWCGYELSEEEQTEEITCPFCGKFPFKCKEIQVYDNIVQVVMFREESNEDKENA